MNTFVISALPGVASLHGNFYNASEEATVIAPDSIELDIELRENTWAPAVGNDKWASKALLASLVSQQSEAYGWNQVVRRYLQERYLKRQSDHLLTLTLPQYGIYEITSPETLDVVLPGNLVSSGANVTSPSLVVIRPRAGRAIVSGGSLAKFARAIDVATAPSTIDVELLGDSFRPDLSVSATMVTNASGTIATAALLGVCERQQQQPERLEYDRQAAPSIGWHCAAAFGHLAHCHHPRRHRLFD